MTLEKLEARAEELQSSLINTTNQLLVLQGHKNEVDYQIKLAKEEAQPVANSEENTVV